MYNVAQSFQLSPTIPYKSKHSGVLVLVRDAQMKKLNCEKNTISSLHIHNAWYVNEIKTE